MYAAQLYRAVLPFVFVPVFLSILGAEAYSVLSFYLTMVALLGLLDIGFSSAIIKIFSGSTDSDVKRLEAFGLLRKFLVFVLFTSTIIIFIFYFFKSYLAYDWLQQNTLNVHLDEAIFLLGVTIGLTYLKQFLICFFTAVENHLLVAILNIVSPSLCYGGGWMLLHSAEDLPKYFAVLSVVCLCEVIFLSVLIYRNYRRFISSVTIRENVSIQLGDILKPTLLLGAVSMLWVVVSQSDKLLASFYMEPAEFSYYQIGSQLAGVLAIITVPLIQYLMPKVNRLCTEGRLSEYKNVFFKPFIFFVFVAWNLVVAVYVNGEMLISLWLQGEGLATAVAIHAKFLFLAAFFSAVMQFVFLIVFSQQMVTEHLKAYLMYAILVVAGVVVISVMSPNNIAIWCFLHACAFVVWWGYIILSRVFTGLITLLVFLFIALPLGLYMLEIFLAYIGLSQNPLFYFAVRILVFGLCLKVIARMDKMLLSKVFVK